MQVEFVTVRARSVPRALADVAEKQDATALVLGSSTAGAHGHVVVGSTADVLLHTSRVPVAVAPRGYQAVSVAGAGPLDVPVHRLTVAFGGTPSGREPVRWAQALTREIDVRLRVASFGVQATPMYPPEVGLDIEAEVSEQWREQVSQAQRELGLGPDVELVTSVGTSWADAMDRIPWEPGEVLIAGSSSVGGLRAVSLGSGAAKIVRHSPVPVLVVPRGSDPLP
jgi:nucleotide-binding universal stress UspA family protein